MKSLSALEAEQWITIRSIFLIDLPFRSFSFSLPAEEKQDLQCNLQNLVNHNFSFLQVIHLQVSNINDADVLTGLNGRIGSFLLPSIATGTGTATVTVTANGNGHKAGETISIGVRAPNPPVISVTRAMIGKDATKHSGFSPFKADDNQWATLELTGFPSVDCGGIFSFLTNCTYNCTEQISSKGISLLAIRNMLPEDRQKQIDKMIPELLQQRFHFK